MFGLPVPRLPVWAWALIALGAWGAWHRYQAISTQREFTQAKVQAAAANAKAEADAQRETARRTIALQKVTDDELLRRQAAELDRDRLRAERGQLRAQLAAQQPAGDPGHPAAAPGRPPVRAAAGVLADVLEQCSGRVEVLAGEADKSRGAHAACERAYDALTR